MSINELGLFEGKNFFCGMKTIFISSLLLLLSISAVSAQRLTISLGPAFPIADFGNEEVTNEKAGNATVGLGFKVKNEFLPGSVITPSLMGFYYSNGITGGQFEEVFPQYDFKSQQGYRQGGGGVGVTIQTRKEGINVGMTIDVGIANFSSASYIIEDTKTGASVIVHKKTINTPFVMVGAMVKIPAGKKTTVNFSLDYAHAHTDFGALSYSQKGLTFGTSPKLDINYQALVSHIGLSFNF